MDLDAYFARIGWTGARTALADIYAHHVRAIPFENLDVLLGRPPKLDVPSLEAKLVTARRGGYCYEHATLFAALLGELGFAGVRTHSARVVMMAPRHLASRTHMFLTLGELVLDPGFGGQAPPGPLAVGTQAGRHRVVRDELGIALEMAGPEGSWQRLWVSTLEHDHPIDFEMANHFTATHPSSPFTQRLMARAFTPDGRIGIMNRDVTIVRGGQTETRQLADRAELRALFAEHFGFDLPELAAVRIPQVPDWQ